MRGEYTLGQAVMVSVESGQYLGTVVGIEPGENLARVPVGTRCPVKLPIEGPAYHVRVSGNDTAPGDVFIVGCRELSTVLDGLCSRAADPSR